MSLRVPEAATLLQAAADYLDEQLLPTLAGFHRYQTRVTVNVLRTLTRELQLAPAQRQAERERLAALLGHDDEPETLEAQLAAAIASGNLALDDPALIEHLRLSLRESLAIDNPKWALDIGPNPIPPSPGD